MDHLAERGLRARHRGDSVRPRADAPRSLPRGPTAAHPFACTPLGHNGIRHGKSPQAAPALQLVSSCMGSVVQVARGVGLCRAMPSRRPGGARFREPDGGAARPLHALRCGAGRADRARAAAADSRACARGKTSETSRARARGACPPRNLWSRVLPSHVRPLTRSNSRVPRKPTDATERARLRWALHPSGSAATRQLYIGCNRPSSA